MKTYTAAVIGMTLFSTVTSSEVLTACHYPGCTCEEFPVSSSKTFNLTCHVTTGSEVRLPGLNVSANIVSVFLVCSEGERDPVSLLDRINLDLQNVQTLTLRDCVTSLAFVFNSSRFSKLTTLSVGNTTLFDQDISDVISQRPLLTTLEVSKSERVKLQTICPLTQLVHLTLTGCHITNLSAATCDTNKTLFNLTKLDLSHNDITSFPSLVSMAPLLVELYLQFNKLSNIPPDAFRENVQMEILDLSFNNLKSLPAHLLSNQPVLRELKLSCNQLTALPDPLLTKTENLTHLDLSFNRFRFLVSGVFSNLHNLNILNLSSNSLSFLLRAHLAGLKNLTYLDMGNNSLRNIPDLTSCPTIKMLDFRHNQIKRILGSSLRGLSNLEGIGLRYNRLTSFSLKNIAVSRKLNVLDFSHNNISYISYTSELNVSVDLTVTDSLSVLGTVRIMLLNNNQLTDIYGLSRYFTGLEFLMLDHNQISTITSSDFPLSIQGISLSYNRITSIERYIFQRFPHLKDVNLQFNYPHLSSLPVTVVNIDTNAYPKPNMYIAGNLYLCNCRMAYLKTYHERDQHKSFQYFSVHLANIADLEYVLCITESDSTMRKLVEVPEEEFMCVDEEKVCEILCGCCEEANTCPCRHNCPANCTCMQGGSPWGEYAYKTKCDNSSLTTVPQVIPPPTTHLYLQHTNITELHKDEFVHLRDLKQLFLNHSKISDLLPGCFNGLARLTHLYLNDNRLRDLSPGVWTGLGKLTHLCLQTNRLQNLEPGTFMSLQQLQYLDLSQNLLTSLSTVFFPQLPSSSVIVISNNPLSCSCRDMRQTISFLTVYGPNVAVLDSLNCVIPFNLTETDPETTSIGAFVDEQDQKNLTLYETVLIKDFDIDVCNRSSIIVNETRYENQKFEEDSRYAVSLSVLCVLFVAAVVVAIVTYRKRREIQAWLFVKFGVRVRPRNAGLDETGRTYDAFVSYSSHDEHLVVHELAPRLEEGLGERRGKRHYQLCLHYRDFPVGDCIADTIIESIEASKRTIMLLSDNFLASEWCRYEFQTAHHHVLKERSHRLIIVLLHEIDDRKLDPDLRVHLKAGNFLRYNDPWFWEKLYFALPDVPVGRHGQKHANPVFNNEGRQADLDNEWNKEDFQTNKREIKFDNF